MDLSEEQAEALFGDDRGSCIEDVDDHHMTIRPRGQSTTVVVEGDEYVLSSEELDAVLDDLNCESVWWLLATETTMVVESIVTHTHE